ncbi:uncharacterized protein A4U43_C08F24460 [Asparagus officinalis]|nr:uncharacterized protein A4U43_C08F24460 [Asparagus officinalis]
MAELRAACQTEIRIRRQRSELSASSFRDSLRLIRSKVEANLENRDKLAKLKGYLRQLETDLNDVLSVRTCKEAKHTAIAKSISAAVARTEQLEKKVQDQRARKDEYAALVAQQLLISGALEEKSDEYMTETKNIEEAIMWYKRVLGFRTEGGEGVKFIFNNIDLKNADKEYAFTIRLDGDIYKLMSCDPCVENVNDLITGLNKTNDLFKFVRILRQNFQAAALNETLPTKSSFLQESISITISSPPPISVDSRKETPLKENIPRSQPKKPRLKSNQRLISGQDSAPSPQSISNRRRSPRFADKELI